MASDEEDLKTAVTAASILSGHGAGYALSESMKGNSGGYNSSMANMTVAEAEELKQKLSKSVEQLTDLNGAVDKGNMDGLEEMGKLSDDIKKDAQALHEFTHQ